MKKLANKIVTAAMTALPVIGLAQVGYTGPQTNIRDVSGVVNLIGKITNTASVIFFAIAVLFIIWAAYLYLTAGGDEEKFKKAKTNLLYAIIAIVIALLAGTAQGIITSVLNL